MTVSAAYVLANQPLTKPNTIRSIHQFDLLVSKLVLTTSGTISTQSDYKDSGMLFALTGSEAGRYDVQVSQKYKELVWYDSMIIGPDDNAMTDAKGIIKVVRNIDVGEGANDGTFRVQFVQNTDLADDDVQDNATVWFVVLLRRW